MKKHLLGAILLLGVLGLAGCGSDDGASSSHVGFCDATQEFNDALDSINKTISDTVSPDDLRDEMKSFMNTVDDLVENAPQELADDARTVRDGISEFAEVLEEYGHDIEEVVTSSDTATRLEVLTSEGFLTSRDNLDSAFADKCE